MAKLSIEAQEYLRELAANVDAAFRSPESGITVAYDLIEAENLEADQKIALWGELASDVRRELKKEARPAATHPRSKHDRPEDRAEDAAG